MKHHKFYLSPGPQIISDKEQMRHANLYDKQTQQILEDWLPEDGNPDLPVAKIQAIEFSEATPAKLVIKEPSPEYGLISLYLLSVLEPSMLRVVNTKHLRFGSGDAVSWYQVVGWDESEEMLVVQKTEAPPE